jgi:hypothetical protein
LALREEATGPEGEAGGDGSGEREDGIFGDVKAFGEEAGDVRQYDQSEDDAGDGNVGSHVPGWSRVTLAALARGDNVVSQVKVAGEEKRPDDGREGTKVAERDERH